ncbi:MAG: glycosyltransferase [Acidimicrobiales bacterium]
MSSAIWIVCPVYFDVASFRILKQRVLDVLTGFAPDQHVRFVVADDSAGADPAIDDLRADPEIRVITPPFNLGHQRCIVHALRVLVRDVRTDDLIVTMDADGQDRPEDLAALLAPLREPGSRTRLVLAKRTSRQESRAFRLSYVLFKLAFRVLTGTTLATGNFAAFSMSWARTALLHPYFDLAYSSTLVTFTEAVLVPSPRGSRYEGRSRMTSSRLVMHGIRLFMPFLDRVAVRSLLAFAVTLVAGIAAAMVIVGVRLFTDLAIPGWATYTLLLVLLITFVSLGNFVVLFAVFSQSQGISFSSLERSETELAREPPSCTG